jgi:hypothetical protein
MHPTSRNCREFLQAVLQVCHRMVLTAAIQEEWNRHQSKFARTWRRAMMARKKIERVNIPDERSLERRITRTVGVAAIAAIIEKNRRLIEAAVAAEKRVASLDDHVRKHIRAHRDKLPELRNVCWVNPSDPTEEAVTWLESGAPLDPYRTLGYTPHASDE